MILGHTYHSNENLIFDSNTFVRAGCNQTTSDHGAIAFMQTGSTGTMSNNVFVKCQGKYSNVPIYNVNEENADSGWVFSNNVIYDDTSSLTPDPIVGVSYKNSKAYVIPSLPYGVNAQDVSLYFTTNGEKPSQDSTYYYGQSIPIETATSVLFKMYQSGKIESAAVGGIFDPRPH